MTENISNNITFNDLHPENKKLLLLQQELDVNQQQQIVINQKMHLLKESMKQIPDTDPEYVIFLAQLDMHKIELDELKNREENLEELIKSL